VDRGTWRPLVNAVNHHFIPQNMHNIFPLPPQEGLCFVGIFVAEVCDRPDQPAHLMAHSKLPALV